MYVVADGFSCKRCNGTTQETDLAADLVVHGETYGCIKRFYYVGETLDGYVETDLASTASIRIRLIKIRELLSFLTSRAPPIEMKGRVVCQLCQK